MSRFAVACGHALTAEAATEALRAGGTAVDAAVSAALTAMAAEPVLAGLLGGGFLMVREPSGQAHLLDFFVQTPGRQIPEADLDFREIHADFGTTTQTFHIGTGTIATPGVAPGLAEAHARFGRIPLKTLAEPAARAARDGVGLTDYQARLSQIVAAILTESPEVKALFCQEDQTLQEGQTYRNPAFADVLEVFAQEGPRFVTEGEVAQALLSLADQGGHLQAEDLKTYTPEWRKPLVQNRFDRRISLNPPPSLGGALIAFGLQILPRQPDIQTLLYTLDATLKARIDAGLDTEAREGCSRLLAPDLLNRYRTQIAHRATATKGTTHISVIDGDGMGAALTLSNGEGCGLIAPGTGIMPNNMLGEEDLLPHGFDRWVPNQRMASMMCPMVIDWPDGRFAMLGSGGSNRIRTALLQVLISLIDREEHLTDAIEAPRVHVDTGDPVTVDFEDLIGEGSREAVLAAYPQATPWPDRSMFFGGVHAVLSGPKGTVSAAGDPRRAGVAEIG